MELYGPKEVWAMDREKFLRGGCGAEGWKVDIVPDAILGVSIQDSCRIHDAMYGLGINGLGIEGSNSHKEQCDRVFLNNMYRQIDNKKKQWRWTKKLRKHIAWGYFQAVVKFGGPAYWDGKNESTLLQSVVFLPHRGGLKH